MPEDLPAADEPMEDRTVRNYMEYIDLDSYDVGPSNQGGKQRDSPPQKTKFFTYREAEAYRERLPTVDVYLPHDLFLLSHFCWTCNLEQYLLFCLCFFGQVFFIHFL